MFFDRRQRMKMETMIKNAQKKVDKFNGICDVGQDVKVKLDDGSIKETVTKSEAEVMSGTAVVWLKGIRGSYLLERVKPVKPEKTVIIDNGLLIELLDEHTDNLCKTFKKKHYHLITGKQLVKILLDYIKRKREI
jgi:hypothetical protein